MTCQQMVHRRTQRINISTGVRLPMSAVLFGRCISLRSETRSIFNTCLFKLTGCSEVDDHDLSVRLQHDIARFHIAETNLHSILADIQDAIERAKQGKLALYWQRTIQREYRCKKVTLAAQLDATNINIQAVNKRDKVAKKVKDVVKFKIGFTIVKNITAETGERTIYVRITKPDNDVLTKNPSNTFPYEIRELGYSIKKYFEYNGEEQNITEYWNVEEYLYAGTYRVDLFADGTLIGSQSFTLD